MIRSVRAPAAIAAAVLPLVAASPSDDPTATPTTVTPPVMVADG